MLPPGGALNIEASGSRLSIPLWLYWLQLSELNAAEAANLSPSDALLDNLSALWVPKTCATWPDALLAAGHSAPRQAPASPVLACRGVG